MDQIFTFHQTTLGHRHIKEHSLCEDASFSLLDAEKGFSMAAVADGHGSAIYSRSRFGSAFAVQAAQHVFTEFVEKYTDKPGTLTELFSNEETMRRTMRRLTDAILEHWLAAVDAHVQENPVEKEELAFMPLKFADMFANGVDLPTMYGTTLIAALRMEDFLILVQQGDGRCVVFYEDGSFNQPIPWDKLCYDTVTTSLCEDTAGERFRSHVIRLKEEHAAAVFLGTDGVEDSFKTMEYMHIYYMQLLFFLQGHPDTFNEQLGKSLSNLTKKGSQDDISIAGIVDTRNLPALLAKFQRFITKHTKRDQQNTLQKKINEMHTQHTRLKDDLHHCELAVLEKTSAKLKKGTAISREALEEIIRNADPRLTETCFDCIEARINFEGYHKRFLEILGQQKEDSNKS